MEDLGTLGGSNSLALLQNADGRIVGTSDIAGDADQRLFAWTEAEGMIDLGTLGGRSAQPQGINRRGDIVGVSYVRGNSAWHAFISSGTEGMVDLGTFGGAHSTALAVNDDGQVAGWADTVEHGDRPFLWTKATGMVDLGTLGGEVSLAHGMNATGQVIGSSNVTQGPGIEAWRAFSWTAQGGPVSLGTLGGRDSGPVAINASGQVVGSSDIAGGAGQHAFLWSAIGGMIDLGTLGGRVSEARGLNAAGQVIGRSLVPGGAADAWHPFSWTATGGMIDLGLLRGALSCAASAVNVDGMVVGNCLLSGKLPARQHAFSWTVSGGLVDLGTLGGSSSVAFSLADNGQIIGESQLAGDRAGHAVRWYKPNGVQSRRAPVRSAAITGAPATLPPSLPAVTEWPIQWIEERCPEFAVPPEQAFPGNTIVSDIIECRVLESGQFASFEGRTYYYARYCFVDSILKDDFKDIADHGSCADGASYFGGWHSDAVAVFVREGSSNNLRLVTTQYEGPLSGHFDTPDIVLTPFGAIMELPFHISATCDCNGSTYYLLRRNTRQWQRLDWDGWQQNLDRRLPPGFESHNGFWPRLATMFAGGELWRKDDAHCCPTGGTVEIQLGINASRFVLKSLKVRLARSPRTE